MHLLYVAGRIPERVLLALAPMGAKIRINAFKLAAGVVVLCAGFVFGQTAVEALWYAPDTEVPVPEIGSSAELALPEDYPTRFRVPVLGIDARVQHVGVNAKGNMAAPNNFTDVGWYKYGTPPGFVGSAVVAGHVDNGLGLPGVFKDLSELKIGDDIFVEREDGVELRFVVTEIQVYPYTHVPRDILFSRTDVARLNLITCEGAWVAGERTYDQRLVVYAELAQ